MASAPSKLQSVAICVQQLSSDSGLLLLFIFAEFRMAEREVIVRKLSGDTAPAQKQALHFWIVLSTDFSRNEEPANVQNQKLHSEAVKFEGFHN